MQDTSWPAFRVLADLVVQQDGREHRSRIETAGRETVIRVDLPGLRRPERVVLDPDGWVLKGD